jgi:hypothetical protein
LSYFLLPDGRTFEIELYKLPTGKIAFTKANRWYVSPGLTSIESEVALSSPFHTPHLSTGVSCYIFDLQGSVSLGQRKFYEICDQRKHIRNHRLSPARDNGITKAETERKRRAQEIKVDNLALRSVSSLSF